VEIAKLVFKNLMNRLSIDPPKGDSTFPSDEKDPIKRE